MIAVRKLTATVLILAALAVPAAGARAKSYCERLYESARRDYYALLDDERKQRFHSNWDKVIDRFRDIQDKYPECQKAPDALFNMGVLYRKLYRKSWLKDDLRKARDAFLALPNGYASSRLADDALLFAAEIDEELGDKAQAYKTYDRIVSRYSRGDMVKKARSKLEELAAYAPRPEPAPSRPAPGKVRISDIKYWSNPDYTRVVVYGSGPMKFSKNLLNRDPVAGKPPRLYIDIKGAWIPRELCDPITIADGLLQRTRVGQYDQETVRVVLDIDSMVDHRLFTMENPSRLVVDVVGDGGRFIEGTDPPAGSEGSGDGGRDPLPLARQLGLSVKTIVLDPGHGGKDPGAIGRNGLKEKNVTLAVAMKMKPLLEARGYRVLMTRQTDVYVELHERTAFANKHRADLFISIHTNASRDRRVRGVETYFLGVAKSREASETALLENAINQDTLADLEKILLDLTRTANLKQSSLLAETIQDGLFSGLRKNYSNVRNLGVKQASFYVLIGAQMPSVLVETSFISNPEGEKRLKTGVYQGVLAESITSGILKYVDQLSADLGATS